MGLYQQSTPMPNPKKDHTKWARDFRKAYEEEQAKKLREYQAQKKFTFLKRKVPKDIRKEIE